MFFVTQPRRFDVVVTDNHLSVDAQATLREAVGQLIIANSGPQPGEGADAGGRGSVAAEARR